MSSPALPLTPIVNVSVLAGPALGVPPTYNQGLIIGPSAVITHANRVAQFPSTSAMLTYGFTASDPEYLAAQLYFDQSPSPEYVWIGLQDATSIATIIVHTGAAGTGYAVGDRVFVTQVGGSGGTASVATISTGGVVTGLTLNTVLDGTGYTTATALATTTSGSGTGLEVDITVGETALTAFQNCRLANTTWYAGMVTSAVTADHEAIAAYVQSAQPVSFYYCTSSDAAVLNNTSGNLAATLKTANYSAIAGIYSTTQGGAAPNNAYACAAAMGLEMGLNTGLPNSYFTMWGKVLVGVTPEPLTQAPQVNVINGNNFNVYVGYVNQYTILQPGITPSGIYIDQILNRALLQVNLQFALMNLLISVPSVPQTDPGEQQLIHTCNTVCQNAVNTGYLAPGTYEGIQPVLQLEPGDPLPAGFLCQAYPYSTQTAADHAARKAMPIYIVVNEAGAVQSLVVGVLINL